MMRKYKFGLYIGRFQPFHKGHKSIIDQMLSECDKVIIAIGSAQESNTEKNPFRYDYRRMMIEHTYPEMYNRIMILGICDRQNPSDDSSWGEYLLNQIRQAIDITPDAIYQGLEDKHRNWFDTLDIPVINVDRGILEISATMVRDALLKGHVVRFQIYVPSALHKEYENMRSIVKNVRHY